MTRDERDAIARAIAVAEDGTSGKIAVRVIPDKSVDALERARSEFARTGLHRHEHENAVLILVAPKARQFAILGDRALHERVGEQFWQDVVDESRPYFARDSLVDGILHAVGRVGSALRTHFAAFVVLLAIALAWLPQARAADFAIPPAPDHRVTDNAGVLSSGTRATLESELTAYEKATGHQVVVWVGQSTGEVPLETWTAETANHWKIGRKGHDDGVVLFLFMQDHKARIEVGYGLEGSLPDASADRIIRDDIVPRMRAGDVDAAVSNGVAAILTTISPSYKGVSPPPAAVPTAPTTVSSGLGFGILALMGLFFAFLIFMVAMQIVGMFRYGYLVMREGSKRAKDDMRHWWFWGAGGLLSGSSSSSFGGGGFSGGGFSGGGGSFGGGGASGGW